MAPAGQFGKSSKILTFTKSDDGQLLTGGIKRKID